MDGKKRKPQTERHRYLGERQLLERLAYNGDARETTTRIQILKGEINRLCANTPKYKGQIWMGKPRIIHNSAGFQDSAKEPRANRE